MEDLALVAVITEKVVGLFKLVLSKWFNGKSYEAATVIVSIVVGWAFAAIFGMDALDAAGYAIDQPGAATFLSGLGVAGLSGILHFILDYFKARS